MSATKTAAVQPPRMGDAADICARVDRLGNVEQIVARLEVKMDHLIALMQSKSGKR